MPFSGLPSAALNLGQSQAQWDAIASIKSTSPFASPPRTAGSTMAAAFDAMLPGYGTAVADTAPGDASAQITERVRDAQQSTIDLFA